MPVLLVLLIARVLLSPEVLAQQTDSTAGPLQTDLQQEEVRGVALEQNFPNPFSNETRIPFILGEDLFEDGRTVVVTVRIFNVLRQIVAIPTAIDHPMYDGRPVSELRYDAPGRHLLHWDGRDTGGREVSSGIYFCQIIVTNGARAARDVRKMIVTR